MKENPARILGRAARIAEVLFSVVRDPASPSSQEILAEMRKYQHNLKNRDLRRHTAKATKRRMDITARRRVVVVEFATPLLGKPKIAETIIDSVNARLPEKERVTVDAVRKDIRLLLGKPKIAETILDSINARLPEKEHLTLETFAKRLQSLLDEPQSSKK